MYSNNRAGLIEFTGEWDLFGIPSSVVEWIYTSLPISCYMIVLMLGMRILVTSGAEFISNIRGGPKEWRPLEQRFVETPQHNPKAFLYLLNFIVCFAAHVGLVGIHWVEVFRWQHGDVSQEDASNKITFPAGVMALTLNAIVNPMIYCL
eukprot:sb/3473652/